MQNRKRCGRALITECISARCVATSFLRYRLIGYYPMERKRIVYKKCKCLYTFHGLYTHHGSCLVGSSRDGCPHQITPVGGFALH